jgi:hypothetical protein
MIVKNNKYPKEWHNATKPLRINKIINIVLETKNIQRSSALNFIS